jgi:hypothetical protein
VLLAPGPRADLTHWNDALLREMGLGRLGSLDAAPAGGGWRLVRRVAGHPVLEGFPARPGEPLSTARFQRTRTLDTPARVLLEHAPDRPALVEATDALLWTPALDAASGDLAVSGAFLPLVHQCARVLGRGTAAASLRPGERWRAPAGAGEWRIVAEDGGEVPVALVTERGATRVTSAPLERPGLYRVLAAGQLRGSIAVNPDPAESDLTPRPERELLAMFPEGRAQVLRPGADFSTRLREARHGRELWPWFLALALLLLVAESILGRVGLGAAPTAARPAA